MRFKCLSRSGPRPLRGGKLDAALATLLRELTDSDAPSSAFTISALTRKLGLGSRNALSTPTRQALIAAALPTALTGKDTRSSQDINARCLTLQQRLLDQEHAVETLQLQLIHVAINAHRLGFQPEKLLAALQRQPVPNADALYRAACDYLTTTKLLQALEPNPR